VDLSRNDVAGAFAGLRPLATDPGGTPGSTVKASREHRIRTDSNGLVRISGGKYTTYRLMALQAVDAALGFAAAKKRPSRTHETPIVGSATPLALAALGARLATDAVLERSSADRLVARYGTEASDVVRLGKELGLLRPLGTGPSPLEVEVVWSVRNESALSVDDFLARRTRLAQELPDRAAAVANRDLIVVQGIVMVLVFAGVWWMNTRAARKIQKRIDAVPAGKYDAILLGYGRCSNGTAGLQAGPHRLVLPAVDDCISLLLGSRRRYLEEFKAFPGTYYYTRGWVDYIDDPYREYLKMIPRYGEDKARRIAHLILAHYRRVALVDTGTYDLAACDEYLRTVSEFYDLPLEVLPGSLRLLEKLVDGGPHDGEFITVEPGDVLDEPRFWEVSKSK